VSWLFVATIQYHAENGILFLFRLVVHEDFRHQGIAREIMNYLVNFAKEQKLTSIRFNTMQVTGNVTIFLKFGFSVISEKPSVLCEGLNGEQVIDVQMEMNICN
jgi:GNAT superfamily N-acetyltransferase